MTNNKILLIDGFSILFRGFYAIPVLATPQGEYTNAIYGFMNIFLKFLDEEMPSKVAVAFDLPEPTFRHKKFADYKGNRKPTPPEFTPQVPIIKELLTAMNIPIVTSPGFEADDVLGSFAVQAEQLGYAPIIVSGDRDLLQLATEHTKIRIPKTKKSGKTEVEDYNAKDVFEKYGVTPAQYIDVKALMGDTSDNIPGVPGIGEVTALKIIQACGSLNAAIKLVDENVTALKPKKAAENLLNFQQQAILSQKLATIVLDAPFDFDFSAEYPNMWNDNTLAIVKRLNFKSLLGRFGNVAKTKKPVQVLTEQISILDDMAKSQIPEILPNSADSSGYAAFSNPENAANLTNIPQNVNLFWDVKSAIANNECPPKFALFEKAENAENAENSAKIFDVMLACYILNQPTVEMSAEEMAAAYGKMCQQLAENDQTYLYEKIELPLAFVLADMERYGIQVDKTALSEYGENLDVQISQLTAEIHGLAGETFNINSPAQLSVILFEKFGLKGTKRTKSGYSTAAEVLEGLRNEHPIISKVLAYRTHSKLKSTYVDGLLPLVSADSRIRSTFNQALTATGRISSSEPNLQNIPIRMALGRELRKAFVPADGFVFVDADYSQIELRVLAHMSGDAALIEAFHNDIDIHNLTAAQVFGVSLANVQPQQRYAAKAVNFGIIYGISAFSLSGDLSISRYEAQSYINGYFQKYPNVKKFMDNAVLSAKQKGYASTIFNRRRAVPELNSSNHNLRAFGERVAMNMPIQGTAADIIKIAMVNTVARLTRENLQSRLILQVHDELLLEVAASELSTVKILLKEEMENAVKLAVPLVVDLHEGDNWFNAK
ncbi:MAG: DNA polymerase I [Defluviitaleaceae bacterium]|nr:DNA polymerase I [Defluviitaleaceae bacterium]